MIRPERRRAVKPRALVTGGAVRLGAAIAVALARAGMDVAIGYHRSAARARRTLAALEAAGARAVAIRADLSRPAAARRLVTVAARRLGGLDVLVNSAAVFRRTPFGTTTPAQYDAVLNLNLRGAFFVSQAAASVMIGHGGRIVNIGDALAERAYPSFIPYRLSKIGLVALTRSLAVALRPHGIAVNCVAPGAVLRPVAFPRARWRRVKRSFVGSVDDVAVAVLFFATCPPDVTGQVLGVGDGVTA
jgi:pteridine reductase